MSMYDRVQAVKSTVSIVQFLNDNGYRLLPNNKSQILCFNHDDNEPSARVYPETNSVFCWSCNKAFDVIAACMSIKEMEFNESLSYLIDHYNVQVGTSAPLIDRFYRQATEYAQGNETKVKQLYIDFGNEFRKKYERIRGYRNIDHIIEALWLEYDDLLGLAETPKMRFKRLLDWYSNAMATLKYNEKLCSDLEDVKLAEVAFFE